MSTETSPRTKKINISNVINMGITNFIKNRKNKKYEKKIYTPDDFNNYINEFISVLKSSVPIDLIEKIISPIYLNRMFEFFMVIKIGDINIYWDKNVDLTYFPDDFENELTNFSYISFDDLKNKISYLEKINSNLEPFKYYNNLNEFPKKDNITIKQILYFKNKKEISYDEEYNYQIYFDNFIDYEDFISYKNEGMDTYTRTSKTYKIDKIDQILQLL